MIEYVQKSIVTFHAVQNDSVRFVVNLALCKTREHTSLTRVLLFHRVTQTHTHTHTRARAQARTHTHTHTHR